MSGEEGARAREAIGNLGPSRGVDTNARPRRGGACGWEERVPGKRARSRVTQSLDKLLLPGTARRQTPLVEPRLHTLPAPAAPRYARPRACRGRCEREKRGIGVGPPLPLQSIAHCSSDNYGYGPLPISGLRARRKMALQVTSEFVGAVAGHDWRLGRRPNPSRCPHEARKALRFPEEVAGGLALVLWTQDGVG